MDAALPAHHKPSSVGERSLRRNGHAKEYDAHQNLSCWSASGEFVPGLRRLAILANVDGPAVLLDMREVQTTARPLGLEVVTSEIRRGEDIAPAFETLKGRADALYVCIDPLVHTHRIRINTLALAARLPTMHGSRESVEAAGLMSYGPNHPDLWRRAGDYVDKILRGANPADIL